MVVLGPHAMKWIHGRAGRTVTLLKGAALTTVSTMDGSTSGPTTAAGVEANGGSGKPTRSTTPAATTSLQRANADNDES